MKKVDAVERHARALKATGRFASVQVKLITGRGNGSKNGIPKIRDAVERRYQERGIKCERVGRDNKPQHDGGAVMLEV